MRPFPVAGRIKTVLKEKGGALGAPFIVNVSANWLRTDSRTGTG